MADGNRVDPTRVDGSPMAVDSAAGSGDHPRSTGEPTTDPVAPRWTGSAAVAPAQARRRWWHRRPRAATDAVDASPTGVIAGMPGPVDRTLHLPPADPGHWEITPAVDPWGDQDTPWLLSPPVVDAFPSTLIGPAHPPSSPPTSPPAATPPPSRKAACDRRGPAAGPYAAGPGPSRGPVAPRRPAPGPPPRRRRRWGRRLLLFSLLSAACCCGAPAYFVWPAAQQYPVSAVLPASVADLRLRDDGASRRAADRLAERLRDADLVADDVFAGIYTDRNGKRVALFGTTGFRLTPQADLEAQLQHLADDYHLTDVQSFDLGQTGAHERCGVGRTDGTSVVVCGWADHGSLGTAVLTRRSVTDSADLLAVLRGSVLVRR